ncbi:MAG: preprotein translocase subunit SecG [Rhodospirillales bacterium]|jgi:preprotein translocase subunit SecG
MTTVILVIHLILAIAMVGAILLQRSEGGGLGIGGGSGGGMGGFMSGRATANLLTRSTAILAACFFATSLTLAILAGGNKQAESILDQTVPAIEKPVAPKDQKPSAPLAK